MPPLEPPPAAPLLDLVWTLFVRPGLHAPPAAVLLVSLLLVPKWGRRGERVAASLLVAALLPILVLVLLAALKPSVWIDWLTFHEPSGWTPWPSVILAAGAAIYGLSLVGRSWRGRLAVLGGGVLTTWLLTLWARRSIADNWVLSADEIRELVFRLAILALSLVVFASILAARRLGAFAPRGSAWLAAAGIGAVAAWVAFLPRLSSVTATTPMESVFDAGVTPDGEVVVAGEADGKPIVIALDGEGNRARLVTRDRLWWGWDSLRLEAEKSAALVGTVAGNPIFFPRPQLAVLDLARGELFPVCDYDPSIGDRECSTRRLLLGPGASFLWRRATGDTGRLASGQPVERALPRPPSIGMRAAFPYIVRLAGSTLLTLEHGLPQPGMVIPPPVLCSLDLATGERTSRKIDGLPSLWDALDISPYAPRFAIRPTLGAIDRLIVVDGDGHQEIAWEGPRLSCPPLAVWNRDGSLRVPSPERIAALVASKPRAGHLGMRVRERRCVNSGPKFGRQVDGGFVVFDGKRKPTEAWFFDDDLETAEWLAEAPFQELDESIVLVRDVAGGGHEVVRRRYAGGPEEVLFRMAPPPTSPPGTRAPPPRISAPRPARRRPRPAGRGTARSS